MEAYVMEAQFPATAAELLLPVSALGHRGVVTSHRVLPRVAGGWKASVRLRENSTETKSHLTARAASVKIHHASQRLISHLGKIDKCARLYESAAIWIAMACVG
jgi:hypothetical protein